MWIITYVVVMGNIRNNFGDESLYSILGLLAIAVVLTFFIAKNKLGIKYGLVGLLDIKKYLYFIPFILLISVNFWFGVSMHYDLLHQIFAIITMALVGYVEEIIFRGLLYKAIEKVSIKQAIVISAVTFGAGHIVNLLTGHATLDTFLQIAYAIAIGFAFVMVFYKSKSLIPCIITHSLVNITSKFSAENVAATSSFWKYITAFFIILVAGGYSLYLHKKVR
jgi:membrane protease YdiL (CAAX protease family)